MINLPNISTYFEKKSDIKTISFDVDKFMSRFKLVKSSTLFEPTRQDITKALLEKRCPLCFCKLVKNRDGRIWRCKSVRGDKFIIKSETLAKYF